jgi:CheY-like chemotaxis protein
MAHILLVEDEVSIRLFIRTVLRQKGHVIIEAGDGLEALGLP